MPTAPLSEFARVAAHLKARRTQILTQWHRKVADDPGVGAASSLARAQFIDHIPRILDAFDRALTARSRQGEAAAEADELAGAAEHGEHRWLHGYNSRETLREWGHLHMSMLGELESFALDETDIDASVVSEARMMLAQLFVDCMVESASSHAALERAEAAGRLRELERVLEQLRSVERERTELWREAAHDLRGNVGAVKLAANALGHAVATPELPAFVSLVRKSADSLDTLLNDLIELARLEAGREQRNVARFNARTEISELCDSLQPLAANRQLFLKFDAPAALVVDGDAVKVRRIAQNLILNALKYTEKGGVVVSCADVASGEVARWALTVGDTGVGLDASRAAPLAQALSTATKEAHAVARESAKGPAAAELSTVPTLPSASVPARTASELPSEGVGLSIVKRLCELLDASMELETKPGSGTTFRIIFPRQYSA
ncbi:MAG: histidine kinase [Gammaproteobacteria bacterium]|nr:histidine kinase [Gammaproteobacteria bacterium]